jgi:hypothetical protein
VRAMSVLGFFVGFGLSGEGETTGYVNLGRP